jgi:formylglycine-generating enzyme required for sulfatase activity/serine/threonine protein kinase
MIIPVDQFTRQLAESGLIAPDELRKLLDRLPAEHKSDTESLARELVRRDLLTAWQAQQIYQGQGGQLVLGNYVVLDKLGQGGMGLVLKAQHRRMERVVAIKVLSPSVTKTPAALARFQREVKAAAKLEHPHIVTAYDADEAGGTHFLVMQYVDGTDLSALVKQSGPLPLEKALSCVLQAARGLEYAHGRGVVHRDIKPANLLLDRDGTVKILDMGLARLDSAGEQQDELTGSGQIMGTVDYMAPEQALSTKSADRRADIYSLGITLWYLLTGKPAYTGDSAMAKLIAHRERAIPSLRAACPTAPESLDAVFARMVAKTPEARYQTMAEAIADLERCRGGQEVTAPSVSSAPGEDSRLNEFLRGLEQSAAGRSATAKGGKTAVAPHQAPAVVDESLANTLPVGDTDPTTDQSLLAPGMAAARSGWHSKLPFAPTRRNLSLAGAAAALLLTVTAALWWTNRPTVRVADGDLLAPASGRVSGGTPANSSNPQASLSQSDDSSGSQTTAPYTWPADAPAPAIAPFDAAQARKHQEEWAAHLGVPVEWENSIGMKFVLIPPGEFMMGSTADEIEAALANVGADEIWKELRRSEGPRHKVLLTKPLYLGVHEVTQAQYERVMGSNPSNFAATGAGKNAVVGTDTTSYPVEQVSWNDAAEFCTKLSERDQLKPYYFRSGESVTMLKGGVGYRLPTEAEWEFVCRAGTMTRYWTGDQEASLVLGAWYRSNSEGRTHAVAELEANPFGLYDIHGNVWEWVQDWWEPNYYAQFQGMPAQDPSGPSSIGTRRVFRGGDWDGDAANCLPTPRYVDSPTARRPTLGFRVALAVDAVKALHSSPSAIEPVLDAATLFSSGGTWSDPENLGSVVNGPDDDRYPRLSVDGLTLFFTSTRAGGLGQTDIYQSRRATPDAPWQPPENLGADINSTAQDAGPWISADGLSLWFSSTRTGDWNIHRSVREGPEATWPPAELVDAPINTPAGDGGPALTADGLTLALHSNRPEQGGSDIWIARRGDVNAPFGEPISLDEPVNTAARESDPWLSADGRLLLFDRGERINGAYGDRSLWWAFRHSPQGPFDACRPIEGVRLDSADQCTPSLAPDGRTLLFSSNRPGGQGATDLWMSRWTPAASGQASKPAWHGWSADAPAPAIAPFDAAQARKHREEWAAHLGVPVEWENSIGMQFVLIPPGEFMMGGTPEEMEAALAVVDINETWKEHVHSEAPLHKVVLTEAMYLGVTEVTQSEYERVVGTNPSAFVAVGNDAVAEMDTSRHPVEQVSWNDAADFCAKLSGREQVKPFYSRDGETVTMQNGTGYRLPTEAEWEFACRAGTTTRFWAGNDEEALTQVSWFSANSGRRTHAAGQFAANPFGLFDIHGNVWEWVQDAWDPTYYAQFQEKPAIDPGGPSSAGASRVVRGGSWGDIPSLCRSSYRGANEPTTTHFDLIGFRVAISVDAVKAALRQRRRSP